MADIKPAGTHSVLAHVRVSRETIAQVRAGENVIGVLRPKKRGDGQGPSEAVFEAAALQDGGEGRG